MVGRPRVDLGFRREDWFVVDSPLEGTGFEPSVPRERLVPSFSFTPTFPRARVDRPDPIPKAYITRGPMVRIRLPPAERVCLSPRAAVEGREPRLSARLCAVGLATGSAETRRLLQDRANRRQYLCRAIFQYRSAADGVGENATPVPLKSGGSPSLIVRWISALGPGSTKAQHDPLIVPGKRQA